MKKVITLLVAITTLTVTLSIPVKTIAEDVVVEKSDTSCGGYESNEDCVKRLVHIYAGKYKVSASSMMRTLTNENSTFEFDKQSDLLYKKGNKWHQPVGSRELSFGVAQIHLPDNPEVTKQQATDPAFSIEFMAKQFAEGHQKRWSGYRG